MIAGEVRPAKAPGVLVYYGAFRSWFRVGPHMMDAGHFADSAAARQWADENGVGFIDASRTGGKGGRVQRRGREAARRGP